VLNQLEQGLLAESQCGFCQGHGIVDMIFTASQLQKKCVEQHKISTPFLSIWQKPLALSVGRGCGRSWPSTDVQRSSCLSWGNFSRWPVSWLMVQPEKHFQLQVMSNRMCPGTYFLRHDVLYHVMLLEMIMAVFQSDITTMENYWTCDAYYWSSKNSHTWLLYGDDCALSTCLESTIQHQMNEFFIACHQFGLTISTNKTEAMYQPAPRKPYADSCIMVNDQRLYAVQSFVYLVSILSNTSTIDLEINNISLKHVLHW